VDLVGLALGCHVAVGLYRKRSFSRIITLFFRTHIDIFSLPAGYTGASRDKVEHPSRASRSTPTIVMLPVYLSLYSPPLFFLEALLFCLIRCALTPVHLVIAQALGLLPS
jgi:hypothetical protein